MKTLTDKYLAGQTSCEEEAQLLRQLRQEAHPSREQLALMSMLSLHKSEPRTEWLEEDETDVYDRLVAQRRSRLRLRWRWTAVAAAACIVVSLLIALPKDSDAPTYAMANLYGQEIHDETLVMNMMEGTMCSLLAQPTTDRVEEEMSNLLSR